MLVPHFLKYLWTYGWVIDWLVCRVSKIFHALWGSEGNCQGKWPTDLLAFRTDRVLPLPLAALLQCEHPEFDWNGTFSGLFQDAAQCCVWSSLRFNHAQHVFPWSDMISEYIGSEVPNVNRSGMVFGVHHHGFDTKQHNFISRFPMPASLGRRAKQAQQHKWGTRYEKKRGTTEMGMSGLNHYLLVNV